MTLRRAGGLLALVALWFLFAATYSLAESIAAVVGATLATLFVLRIVRRDVVRADIDPRWILRIVVLPQQVLLDLRVLARHLVRRGEPGVFRSLPFDVGGIDRRAAGRRALLTAAGSLGPNTYVISWDVEAQRVFVHQLERQPRVLPAEEGTYPEESAS